MCPILYVRAAINVRILLSPLWEAREELLSEWSAKRNLRFFWLQLPRARSSARIRWHGHQCSFILISSPLQGAATRKLISCLFFLALSIPIVSAQQLDLVLEGGRVMDPESGVDAVRNVGIRDGKIVRISSEV
jgi:hypothetical protein